MKSIRPSHYRAASLGWFGLVLVLGVLGTVATLVALGQVELPFLKKKPDKANHDGLVAVPVSCRLIPAYTEITRDYLLDAHGVVQVVYLKPESIKLNEHLLASTDKIIGRVVNHDKPAGYVFTENDFLPPGTLPGVVAGVPPGKRALVVEADKIKGIQALRAGNHFDVLSSMPMDDRKAVSTSLGLAPGRWTAPLKRAAVHVLVEDGVVVMPVTTRQVPIASAMRAGGSVQTRPIQEVVIALDAREIAPLTEALDLDAHITCVVRSGRPEDGGPAGGTPGTSPPPQRQVVEIITGHQRKFLEFPLPTDAVDQDRNPLVNSTGQSPESHDPGSDPMASP